MGAFEDAMTYVRSKEPDWVRTEEVAAFIHSSTKDTENVLTRAANEHLTIRQRPRYTGTRESGPQTIGYEWQAVPRSSEPNE
jgi:hypothetical protein